MIQTQTEVLIKDNSGLLKGRVINCKQNQGIGALVSVAVTKAKTKNKTFKKTVTMKSQLQDLLMVQTKKPRLRYDGSSIAFSANVGVAVTFTKRKLVPAFKRINTCVSFEIKHRSNIGLQSSKAANNLLKLANQVC